MPQLHKHTASLSKHIPIYVCVGMGAQSSRLTSRRWLINAFLAACGWTPKTGGPQFYGSCGGTHSPKQRNIGFRCICVAIAASTDAFYKRWLCSGGRGCRPGGAAAASLPWEADDDPGAFSGFYLLDNICYIYMIYN